MQTYNEITNELTGKDLPGKVYENMQSLKSDFSGTEFPTTNLIAGMTVFRTDQNKVYRLLSDLQTWRLERDLSVEGGLSARATNDANGKVITSYVAEFSRDENDPSVIHVYSGANQELFAIFTPTMTGATNNGNGATGLVPQPLIEDKDKVLHGDGSWRKAVGFESYWEANETVQVGEVRFPTGRENSGIVLECVQAGTTGNEQPEIPEVVGMGLTHQDIQTLLTAIEQVQSLNGQTADKITGITDYIVESYRNGTEWYRKYKSGWVEQGGQTVSTSTNSSQVSLLKPFKDATYMVTTMQMDDNGSQDNVRTIKTKTTTTFSYWTWDVPNIVIMWYACGQGA